MQLAPTRRPTDYLTRSLQGPVQVGPGLLEKFQPSELISRFAGGAGRSMTPPEVAPVVPGADLPTLTDYTGTSDA